MGQAEAEHHPTAVRFLRYHLPDVAYRSCRVMNTFKAMIQGEDIIEKEDLPALSKIKAFINSDDVAGKSNAAKPLLNMIERVVSRFPAGCQPLAERL